MPTDIGCRRLERPRRPIAPSSSRSPISRSPRRDATSSASPRTRCPASWRCARSSARTQPLAGRPHRRLAAHDGADRRADRDPRRARRAGALGELQHLLHPGRGGRRRRRRARPAPSTRPPASRCSRGRARRLEEYWRLTDRIFDWSAEGFDGPNLILDDGGDATLLVHKGVEFEKAGRGAGCRARRLRRVPHRPRHPPREPRARPAALHAHGRGPDRRHRGDDDRRPPAVRARGIRRAALPRRSTSTTRSRSRSSTTSTASATRCPTASTARPTC